MDNELCSLRAQYAKAYKPILCVKCDDLINEPDLCLSKSVKSISKCRQRPWTTGQIEGFASLRWQDREKIRQKIINEKTSSSTKPVDDFFMDNHDVYDLEEEHCPQTSKLEIAVQPLMLDIFQPHLQNFALYQYRQQNLPTPDFVLKLHTMPWGRLKHEVIIEACKILTEVLDLLDNNTVSKADLEDLSWRFGVYITADFGPDFQLPLLRNPDPLFKTKLRVLKFFLDSELGYLLLIEIDLTSSRHRPSVQMDLQYINLQCHITTVDQDSEIGQLINKYFKNTCTTYFCITNIFALERYDEEKRFEPFKKQTNRKLLWYGSQTANFAGILSTGLRIVPGRCPSIYFADAVAKSMGYAAGSTSMLVLLCDVALGIDMKLLGGCYPDPVDNEILPDRTIVPCGKLIDTGGQFNEYIVSYESQIRLRYLAQIKHKR